MIKDIVRFFRSEVFIKSYFQYLLLFVFKLFLIVLVTLYTHKSEETLDSISSKIRAEGIFIYFVADYIIRITFIPVNFNSIIYSIRHNVNSNNFSIYLIIKDLSKVYNLFLFFSLLLLFKEIPVVVLITMVFIINSLMALNKYIYLLLITIGAFYHLLDGPSIRYDASPLTLYLISFMLSIVVFEFLKRHVVSEFYLDSASKKSWLKFKDFLSDNVNNNYLAFVKIIFLQIIRNRRVREYSSIGIIYTIFIILFLLHGSNNVVPGGFLFYASLFFLGNLIALNYQLLLFNWDSECFSFFLTRKLSYIDYIKSKHLFFSIICFITYFIKLPLILYYFPSYFFEDLGFLVLNITVVNYFVLVGTLLVNKEKISLQKTTFFNREGVNLYQVIILILVFSLFVIHFELSKSNTLGLPMVIITEIFLYIRFQSNLNNNLSKLLQLKKYRLSKSYQ